MVRSGGGGGGGKACYGNPSSLRRGRQRRPATSRSGNNDVADNNAEHTANEAVSPETLASAPAPASASAASSQLGNIAARTDSSDLMDQDQDDMSDDDESITRPGAYHVPGLAFGEYPAWGGGTDASPGRGEGGASVSPPPDDALAGGGGGGIGTASGDPSLPSSRVLELELAERSQSIAAFLVDEDTSGGGRSSSSRQASMREQREPSVAGVLDGAAASVDVEGQVAATDVAASGNSHNIVPYPVVVDGVPLSSEEEKTKDDKPVHLRGILLLSVLALAGIVIGLSVRFSGRRSHSDVAISQGGVPNLDAEGGSTPSPGPKDGSDSTEEPEEELPNMWKAIGSPIHGLRNESGIIFYIDSKTGKPTLSHGPRSNFTFSGYSLALSDDGRILVVGESGTNTVRTFRWDDSSQDWIQFGQTLKSHRYETDCAAHQASGGALIDCFVSFGFNVDLSRDGTILIVASPGLGILSTFVWNATSAANNSSSGEWTALGSDLAGDDPKDGLGAAAIKTTPNGKTMAVVAAQSIHEDFAALLGIEGYTGRGYAKVYDLVGSTWVQRGETIRGREEHDGLAFVDVSEDGTSIAVGTFFGGYADVYDWDGTSSSWTLRGDTFLSPLGEIDFGSPILFSSPDGNRVVVGSTYHGDDVTTADANLIYVYEWTDGSSWVEIDRLVVMESRSGYVARFSSIDVSSDGSRLVAAFKEGSQMYEWNGERYVQMGEYVEGGRTIALSRDGEVFAVGRPFDNSLGFGLGRTTAYTDSHRGKKIHGGGN